jgi:HD-like signal output (HDOD) protein
MPELSHEQSFELVKTRLKEMGDMPIFSASVNRVHMVSSNPDADAMELAVEVLKDANLTTKVLKLANSPLYNRGQGKIGNLSRAVVVLGFDTVKSAVLTLKLIDSFQHQHPGIDMTGMLVNAYLSGGFVRGISAKCGVKDIEQAYICGLLHNLGEIVSAYTLPAQYAQIQGLRREHNLSRQAAEKQVLGTSLDAIGQAIVSDWEFPSSVVKTLGDHTTKGDSRVRDQTELTGVLSTLANETMELLYAEQPASRKSLAELNYEIAKVAGIKKEQVGEALDHSFKQCCDLAQAYGLNKKHLTPKLRSGGDDDLNKLARQFSFYASSEITTREVAPKNNGASRDKPAQPREEQDETAVAKTVSGGDSNLLLGALFEITGLMSQKAPINTILAKVLEGMHRGIGFDRAVLCLLTPDHRTYTARMSAGQDGEALKQFLSFPVDAQRDLFSKIILEGTELLVTDIDQGGWRQLLPGNFEQATGARSFMLGSLRAKARPVGIFYADKAISKTPITSDEARSFMQLVAQAQLALQMR